MPPERLRLSTEAREWARPKGDSHERAQSERVPVRKEELRLQHCEHGSLPLR
jgi:hypothetical protein